MIDGGMQAAMSLFFSGKLKVGGDPILAHQAVEAPPDGRVG